METKSPDRPFVFCHMMISLDGKIMGNYMNTPEGIAAGDVFDDLAFGESPYYLHQGWLSGRVTTDDNFTRYAKPDLDEDAAPVSEGDFVVQPLAPMYYVSVDPSGRLGWKRSELIYNGTHAQVLEVLTSRASNAYKAFLRKLNISYILAGEDALCYDLLMRKLKDRFGIQTLMLGGGGVLNWSFIQAGMCDELSLMVAPAADGSSQTPSLFETRGGFACDKPVSFALISAQVKEGGTLWLRYQVKPGPRRAFPTSSAGKGCVPGISSFPEERPFTAQNGGIP